MAAILLSPLMMAWAGMLSGGQRLPSIKAWSGCRCSPAIARCMANKVACRMLRRSISSTLAAAMAQLRAWDLISGARASRLFSLRVLESASPAIGCLGSSMTAAAMTGPAHGPRPASSTPAISRWSLGFVGSAQNATVDVTQEADHL